MLFRGIGGVGGSGFTFRFLCLKKEEKKSYGVGLCLVEVAGASLHFAVFGVVLWSFLHLNFGFFDNHVQFSSSVTFRSSSLHHSQTPQQPECIYSRAEEQQELAGVIDRSDRPAVAERISELSGEVLAGEMKILSNCTYTCV